MDRQRKNENSRSEKAVDRNGYRRSEPNKMSRAPSAPRSGFTLGILFGSELFVAVAIDGAARSNGASQISEFQYYGAFDGQ
jgi:hypothetical protein